MTILKLKKLQCIFNYDLVNKYLIKTVHQIPKIKTINVQVNINEVLELNKNSFITIKEKPYKIKTFLLLFFYFLQKPSYKIQKFQKITSSNKKVKVKKNILEIISINKSLFNTLILSLFIENNCLKTANNINSFQKFLVLPSKFENSINFKFLVSSQFFENIKSLGFLIFKNSTFKQLNFNLLVQLYNPNKISNIKSLLYNMPFFWING